jgi:CrcB protein
MPQTFVTLLLIGVAGAAGALARYGLTLGIARLFSFTTLPVGTFLINITGAFILGYLATLVRQRMVLSDTWLLVLGTGFVGAYTTFSTYMLESDVMLRNGEWLRASAYLAGSLFLGMVAVRLGFLAAGGATIVQAATRP